jgi:hypothetical protein
MRKILLTISVLFFAAVSIASDIQPYPFPFIGKWDPSEDPMLIADYGLQDIQNLRKDGKHFKGVKGHTKVNTTSLSDLYVVNGFHFRKDQPQESHVIVYAGDATTPTTGNLYQNTTAIPTAGDFSSTVLYTPTAFTDTFRFSNAPAGNMVSSNAAETLIWGGNELPETAFFTSSASVLYTLTNSLNFSDILNNSSQAADQVARLSIGIDSYVKLLIHAGEVDGTAGTSIIDSSGSSHTITAVGDAQVDTAFQKFGTGSVLFDGTGDYLTVPDHADWYFAAAPFTIDTWVRFNSITGVLGIVGQYVDASNYWYFNVTSGNNFTFRIYSGGVIKANYSFTLSVPLPINTWYHIELVRNGTDVYLFINGVSQTPTITTVITTNEVPDLAAVLEVGGSANHGYIMNGWLDEFRISKGVARHTSNFAPPTREYALGANYFLVGSRRPLQGVKFYINSPNTETSTLTVKEQTGNAWSLLTSTDNTRDVATSTITLARTGTVTWPSTVNTSKVRYINGLSLYWYQFYFDAGSAQIYYVTVDAPMQSIKNVWDGTEVQAAKLKKYDGTSYTDSINEWGEDYINLVGDNDDNTFADFSSLTTSQNIILGFTEPQQGFDIRFVPTKINSTDNTTMTVKYGSGSTWTKVNGLTDGTATANKSFNRNGVIVFSPVEQGQEFTQEIGESYALYYYQISFAATLSTGVQVSEIRGIPAPQFVPPYKFSTTFQNRLFLFNETNGDNNKAIYSTFNSPDIWNGSDTGMLLFGDKTSVTAAASIYNVFNTTGGIEQLIVTKKNETYRLTGTDPKTWSVQRISTNVGCIAPLTMTSADMTAVDNVKRQIAIWMSDKGVFMSDGATVQSISEDIRCYFNPVDVRYIPSAMQTKSVGWYDPSTKSYKLLIASGAGATYLNTELEYSLKYQEWTKIYRESVATANPLQSGWNVTDTNGMGYTYGGGKNGFVYRLENSNRWDGTRITSYLHTKDLILDQANPLFRLSTAKTIRTTYKKKQTGAITIEHFGDGVRTISGVDGQEGPATITAAAVLGLGYDTQSVLLGPYLYHSFKFQATTNIEDGLELTGFGLYYEPYNIIR